MSDSKTASAGAAGAGTRYLVADIGGTNSRMQLFQAVTIGADDRSGWEEKLVGEKVYPSAKATHLNNIIFEFLAEMGCTRGSADWPQYACLAVAGPVKNNQVTITNLAHWGTLVGADMCVALGIAHVTIINDFVAIGYGLLALNPAKDLHVLRDAPRLPAAPIACIGAGTGLGETFLTHTGTEYTVWPAEGGHCDLAPRNALEFDLMRFLLEREGIERCSVERVVSGPGLHRIYEFLCIRNPNQVSAAVTAAMRELTARGADSNGAIVRFAEPQTAADGTAIPADELCVQTVNTFISAYGAEAGNMALKTLPYGGFYIAGGIAPRILPLLTRNNAFWKAFTAKGRMKDVLSNVPLYVVTHPQVGLLGAQVICRRGLRATQQLPSYLSPNAPVVPDFHRPKAEREAAHAAAAAKAQSAAIPSGAAAGADVKVVPISAADADTKAGGSAITATRVLIAAAGVAVAAAAAWAFFGAGKTTASPKAAPK